MADDDTRNRSSSTAQKAIIGAGLAAAAGTAAFLLARRTGSDGAPIKGISDAPDHVWRRGSSRYDRDLVGNTVTDRPAGATRSIDAWRDFTRFPGFMDNVENGRDGSTTSARAGRSRRRPGSTVELVTGITEDEPGRGDRLGKRAGIRYRRPRAGSNSSTPAPGRGTMVRLTMRYDPPGGTSASGIAKLLQREPHIQARRDLRRFK